MGSRVHPPRNAATFRVAAAVGYFLLEDGGLADGPVAASEQF
jgi:hypothetical protein